MERHGSESYFVLGEGLLGESGGGRACARGGRRGGRAAVPLHEDRAEGRPPVRLALERVARDDHRRSWPEVAGPGGLHLPGPVRRPRPDLRQDGGHARRAGNAGAARAGQIAEPRPRLALRRRPSGPGVGEVLPGRRPSQDGRTDAWARTRRQGFDLPRGTSGSRSWRAAVIPDPRNDENLAVAQTHLAFIRFHNRVVDTLPSSVPLAQRFTRARRLVVKHYQWMLRFDYLPRICDGERGPRCLQQRTESVRGGRRPDGRADHAHRVLGRRLPAGHSMVRRTSTAGTGASTSGAAPSTSCSTSPA